MRWKLTPCIGSLVRVLLIAPLLLIFVIGSPLRWRNLHINGTYDGDDPVWQELMIWSNETSADEPLLINANRTHVLPHALSDEELENETMKHFQLLKLNYSKLLYELDGELKDDVGSGRHLPRIVDRTLQLLNLKQVVSEIETSVMSKVSCTACQAGVGLLLHYIRAGKSTEEIVKLSCQFCVSLKIQSPRVCEGITQLFGAEVVYVLYRISIGPEEICSFIIGDACGDIYNPTHEWNVVFPPVPKPNLPKLSPPSEPNSASFKVLHLSDTHYDPYYEEGTNADCNEPLCCRLTNGPAAQPVARAGRWGDYRKCDTPKRTVDHMLQHISSTHPDIDYILWTGDLPPHDVWNQTREENLKILKETVKQMSSLFPGIPIFPALGNHESSPVNSFPPPFIQNDFAINWLYDELDKQWRQWLPASVSKTIRRGAFYSVLVRPGFRIISLNMNYCNNKNWWLLMNSTDPAKELQWFIYELQSAEFNDEKVHVIGHIPPGHSDCLKVWSRNFYSIIARYEATVTAQFFGHTHYDEFQVFYDPNDLNRAISISYIGPSVTPYANLNPGYRIYYVDGDRDHSTRAVLDHETWVMNLKEANLYDYPIWYKLYAAKVAYQMTSLTPQDWDSFVNKLVDNESLFDLYYKHYWKNSPLRAPCDLECKKRLLCDLRSGRSHDRKTFCQEIESRVDATNQTGWRAWIYNGLALSNNETTELPVGTNDDQDSNTVVNLANLFLAANLPDYNNNNNDDNNSIIKNNDGIDTTAITITDRSFSHDKNSIKRNNTITITDKSAAAVPTFSCTTNFILLFMVELSALFVYNYQHFPV